MNPYERYISMVKGYEVDIIPRVPILMAFAADFIGSNYGEFASDYRVLTAANIRCAETFNFDQVSVISDPYRETAGFGGEIRFVKDGVPRCEKAPLQDTKDLQLLKTPDPYKSERMLDRIMAVREYRNTVFKKYSILGWVEGPAAEAADLRGITNFLFDIMDDEEFSRELMDICSDVGIKFALAQLEEGADTIGIGDAIASQLSPSVYQRLVMPYEKKLIDEIHKAGGLVKLHICGNINHLLPYIKELKVDILDLDWMVDMEEARKIIGDDTVLTGNLNPVNDVRDGTPEKIHAELKNIYERVGNRYMVNAGCEVPISTPYDNLVAMCKPIPYIHENK